MTTLDIMPGTSVSSTQIGGGNFANTHKGMAHFGGTGPRGSSCTDCVFAKIKSEKRQTGTCDKFQQITHKPGPSFPLTVMCCKYFEAKPR